MKVDIRKRYPPYSSALHEWHKPKTKWEHEIWNEHEALLEKVRTTGKCSCGASVEENGDSGNYLQDLGYLYGAECLNCR